MKSIMSIALTAVMLLSVLTGCGQKRNEVATPSATNAPVTATERPAAVTPDGAGSNNTNTNGTTTDGNDVVNDMAVGAEDAVNGMVNGVENAVDDVVEGVQSIPGEIEDGRVDDRDNIVRATPQAR